MSDGTSKLSFVAGEPWTQTEVEILAKEYFEVPRAELHGEKVNKNDALRRAMEAMPSERTLHTLKDRCYRISEEPRIFFERTATRHVRNLSSRRRSWTSRPKLSPIVQQSPAFFGPL
jgi:hypothetical protein